MNTGENEQGLRKVLDMTRLISITLLLLHVYYYCYGAFRQWQLTLELTDRLLGNVRNTGLFNNFHTSKLFALGFLIISLMGSKGRKDEKLNYKSAIAYILTGLCLYFSSALILLPSLPVDARAGFYMALLAVGFVLVLTGGTLLSRIIKQRLVNDIFNRDQETFPQEERLLQTEDSINIKAKYMLKGKIRSSWINIAPYRATIISGNPGAGKTAYVLRQFLTQALSKEPVPYTMAVYDFKYPDLSTTAYNYWKRNKHKYKVKSTFYAINFDDLTRSNRCNPLDPENMTDITDASESARTILFGLNRQWQSKQGDFFVESAINFVTAVIWFLRCYQDGIYCTLAHVIELMQIDYVDLFTILQTERTIGALINPFITAFKNNAMEQLEGQVGSAKIAMARLASPQLYYVLTGNDFTLDINNPEAPKVVCFGNNPQKIQTYGAVISLYLNRLLKLINQKNKNKSMVLLGEFGTVVADVIPTIVTGRSNKVAVVLEFQDITQLRLEYGKEKADVIVNTVGNLISGQVVGDSAKQISERIGKIMQERESVSINGNDTSLSRSKQLEYAVPTSTISSLSSGEFAGMVADTPQQRIRNKAFHNEIITDFEAVEAEEKGFEEIPVIREVDDKIVQKNFDKTKNDVVNIISSIIQNLADDPTAGL